MALNKKIIVAIILAGVIVFLLFLQQSLFPIPSQKQPAEAPKGFRTEQQAGSETGAPVVQEGEQIGVKCPADYCLSEVQGSGPCPAWTGSSKAYSEQECYDYPDTADSLRDCDSKRTIYYKICGVRQ